MKVAELNAVLRVAAKHYRSDGQLETADALAGFAANLLQVNKDQTVAAFVRRASKRGSLRLRNARTTGEQSADGDPWTSGN